MSNDSELFIERAFEDGAIQSKQFSLSIGESQDRKSQEASNTSFLTVGGYDLNKYAQSEITWHPILDEPYWSVPLKKFYLGNLKYEPSDDAPESIIVDSGTSFILMPQALLAEFLLDLQKMGLSCNEYSMICQCNEKTKDLFPDLEIYIEEHKYIIPKSSYVKSYGHGET